MSRQKENTGFICENCQREVQPLTNGSYRNHCPFCLYSKHVDHKPGDRLNTCKGLMEPIDVIYHSKKGYQLVHQCLGCGIISKNKVAENTVQADEYISFLKKISYL